jgi:hypothetical protein
MLLVANDRISLRNVILCACRPVRGLIVADLARCTSKVPEAETLRMAKAAAKFRFIIRLKRWDAGVPRSHGFAARG